MSVRRILHGPRWMTTGPTAISVSETGTAVMSMLLVSEFEYDTQQVY